jgi:hypothetical protein
VVDTLAQAVVALVDHNQRTRSNLSEAARSIAARLSRTADKAADSLAQEVGTWDPNSWKRLREVGRWKEIQNRSTSSLSTPAVSKSKACVCKGSVVHSSVACCC